MFTEEDVRRLIEEDAPQGDVTTEAVLDRIVEVEAEIVSRQDSILAGIEEAEKTFNHLGATLHPEAEDGEEVQKDQVVATVEGDASSLLTAERPALNLVMRMSGIATATHRCVEKAREANPDARVAGTRKTAPFLRLLDKKAVRLGGGDPHRLDLSHAYLVKENHAEAAGSLLEATERVLRHRSFAQKVEVEVETVEEALNIGKKGVDALLLDNFSPDELESCVRQLDEELGEGRPLLEASGGVTPENVGDHARHVDVVSMGWLTHSAPARDYSMRLSV